jgi:lipoyl(octanoyl) transferase
MSSDSPVVISDTVVSDTVTASESTIRIRHLGLQDYEPVWRAMSNFTDTRKNDTDDELWVVEHPRVFTQGQAGKAEHVLMPGDIPVVQVDRGGQVTYHGPGQLVAYPLIDLSRLKLGVRDLVTKTENTLIHTLNELGIPAATKENAPGVYVDGDKIGSLGFRIRKGCSYHGLSLNVNMDLEPFLRINPCGFSDMKMVQTKDLTQDIRASSVSDVAKIVVSNFIDQLNYTHVLNESRTDLVSEIFSDTAMEKNNDD